MIPDVISKYVNDDQKKSAVRWVLTIAAGSLVSKGYLTGSGAEQFIAVGVGASSLIWSMIFHGGPTKIEAIMADPPVIKSAGTITKWPGQ
jgi:hypothetical protein